MRVIALIIIAAAMIGVAGATPTVSIANPIGGDIYQVRQVINIWVDVSDAVGASIFVDGKRVSNGGGPNQIESLDFNWQPKKPGVYSIYAEATDADGNIARSESVTVEVTRK